MSKKIAVLYSWWNWYGWIYTFFRDIVWNIKKNNKSIIIDVFSVTELMPWDIFDNNFLFKTNKTIKKFIFKYNLHTLFSSLIMPFVFYKKLKKYDKIIINQELAFPISFLLKNTVTIIHGTSIQPAKVRRKQKKYLYSIYYYFLSVNAILTYRASKKIYTVSDFTKNIIKWFNNNIYVAWWWVDLNFWKFNTKPTKKDFWFPTKDFLMIFVWRFDEWKWKNTLLDIMTKIKNKNIKLICVSRKPENYKKLEKKWVVFFENISEEKLIDLYSISDLFIFPTKYEWYGSVTAEALSIGLPVITTNTWLWHILKTKYKDKYNTINILEPTDDYKKYINIIDDHYINFQKTLKSKKESYKIEEVNINRALKEWERIFIK